ncbi:hypothetical protein [Desemzia sp. FAM 23991]
MSTTKPTTENRGRNGFGSVPVNRTMMYGLKANRSIHWMKYRVGN